MDKKEYGTTSRGRERIPRRHVCIVSGETRFWTSRLPWEGYLATVDYRMHMAQYCALMLQPATSLDSQTTLNLNQSFSMGFRAFRFPQWQRTNAGMQWDEGILLMCCFTLKNMLKSFLEPRTKKAQFLRLGTHNPTSLFARTTVYAWDEHLYSNALDECLPGMAVNCKPSVGGPSRMIQGGPTVFAITTCNYWKQA